MCLNLNDLVLAVVGLKDACPTLREALIFATSSAALGLSVNRLHPLTWSP